MSYFMISQHLVHPGTWSCDRNNKGGGEGGAKGAIAHPTIAPLKSKDPCKCGAFNFDFLCGRGEGHWICQRCKLSGEYTSDNINCDEYTCMSV